MVFKSALKILILLIIVVVFISGCSQTTENQKEAVVNSNEYSVKNFNQATMNTDKKIKIIFLHHSTGEAIWQGGVLEWFEQYNAKKGTSYQITAQEFPKDSPYGWENYPYDYWNIWVNHAGSKQFQEEPTLEILTQQYDVIIWKHCYPVSDIEEDTGNSDINSSDKRIENYKLHYAALKNKMHEFPNTKFIVWTGATQVKNATSEESAKRAKAFFDWVRNEWDKADDNIYLWDFYELETEGGIYLKNEYAESRDDSHPNSDFSQIVAPYFSQRIIDVIEGRGDSSSITGE